MKKNIAVFFGGRSTEHDVSIITAHTPVIESLLAAQQYEVWPVYIGKDGSWYSDQRMNDLAYFKRDGWESDLAHHKKVQILFDNGLTLVWPGFLPKNVRVDIAFPAMHGTYGEDGSLMGLLRMANVPFVGCDLFASAVAMDKVLTKQILKAEGVPVVSDVWFTKEDWESKREGYLHKIKNLRYPLFIKPVHLGSSIGITKINPLADQEKNLINAIEVALHYDEKVLVEEGVENLVEVTLPIMGNDEPILASIERPLNKTEFFDFQDKYLSGSKKVGGVNNNYSEKPANIEPSLAEKVKELGEKTYKILGCSGIARVDFLIDSVLNQVFVNEVNTLPGSLYQHNWKKSGVSNIDLVEKLLSLAEEKFTGNSVIELDFHSSILEKYSGSKV